MAFSLEELAQGWSYSEPACSDTGPHLAAPAAAGMGVSNFEGSIAQNSKDVVREG
jgi:hypothetical protein